MEPKSTVPIALKLAVYTMFALCIGMGIYLYRGISERRQFFRDLEARLVKGGFEKIESMSDLVVSNAPSKPTWYVAKSVTLLKGSDAPVAMYCATGDITGTVRGDVIFFGIPMTHPALIINPGAEIAGNLETTCWMLKNFGTIRGKLLGTRYFYVTNQTPLTTGQTPP